MPLVWKSKTVVDEVEAARLFHALAHPIRLRIVRLLMDGDVEGCQEIVARLPIAQSTVSQHLKVLKTAGIVSDSSDGPRRRYRFQEGTVDKLRRFLRELDDKSSIYD